ncbi:MAG: dipeptidyl peptidase 3 [candidate division KSB1 bacterium]|nr:dipeptidyl peptidase 3 [candidate division KSB1 bacterium]
MGRRMATERIGWLGFVSLAACLLACGSQERRYFLERVGNTQVVQMYADGFERLPLRQKLLAYHLCQAAIAGRDIMYDQNHRHALEIRRLMEEIITHAEGIDRDLLAKIVHYAKLVWINNGHYYSRSFAKFVPDFTPEQLRHAAEIAVRNGASLPCKEGESADSLLARLRASMFDPQYEPYKTNKTPPQGQDILTASANNLYEGVTLAEVESFEERYPLNSRLVKRDGRLVEEVYRIGTDGIPPGRYASQLAAVVENLERAAAVAEGAQQQALRHLISYYRTGDLRQFHNFYLIWVRDNPLVDTINGFVETYLDPRSVKGAWEGIVFFVDEKTTARMHALAASAQYFEDRAPWEDAYKKQGVQPPVANAIKVLTQTGDQGPIGWAGINLPNEQWIREQHGSKSITLQNLIAARRKAQSDALLREFCATRAEFVRAKRYGDEAADAVLALHEIVGHGSGKVDPKLAGDPSDYLREYYSTLEEARADLMALWNIFDPKLVEIGMVSDSQEVGRAAYDDYVRDDLILLRLYPYATTIEEDHDRAAHLIVSYLRQTTGAVLLVRKGGRSYPRVADYQAMRAGVGRLLAEIMRIKAQGDYAAAKELVTTYGSVFDPTLRDEVVARCTTLDLPTYTAYVNPELSLVTDAQGNPIDVLVTYPCDLQRQMLGYAGYVTR